MKPFTLHAVLDYRKRLEETAQQHLIEAKKNQVTIEKRLADETKALAKFIDESEKLQAEGIGITDLIRHEERIAAQKKNILAIKKNLAEKSSIVDKEQKHLLHCSMERQIMEQLKETQNKAWKGYLNKKEAAMLDELAITRHESGKI